MSTDMDKVMVSTVNRLSAASQSKTLPWDSIINAVISILKGCGVIPPATARERLANAGPFLRLKLTRKLMQGGMSHEDAVDATAAAIKAAKASTDEEASNFLELAAAVDVD